MGKVLQIRIPLFKNKLFQIKGMKYFTTISWKLSDFLKHYFYAQMVCLPYLSVPLWFKSSTDVIILTMIITSYFKIYCIKICVCIESNGIFY